VRSEYEQSKIQHAVDEKMSSRARRRSHGSASKVKEDQLAIRAQPRKRVRKTRRHCEAKSPRKSHVDQQRALYNLRRSQLEALHVALALTRLASSFQVEVGQSVRARTNLARVADPKKLKRKSKS